MRLEGLWTGTIFGTPFSVQADAPAQVESAWRFCGKASGRTEGGLDVQPQRNLAARAGAWSAAHRKTAIFGWIAFVIVAFMIGSATGQKTLDQIDTQNGDSYVADQAVDKAGFPDQVHESILIQSRGDLKATDPAFVAGVTDIQARLERLPSVLPGSIESPLERENGGQISADGRSALLDFDLKGELEDAEESVDESIAAVAAAQSGHPDLRIEQFGDASVDKALTKSFEDDFKKAETLSLPITLVVLLLAFGALVAAGLPLLLGMTAVMATLGLLGPISQLLPVDESIASVVLLIGLAVGVDYCMFYIRREMEERDAGRAPAAALAAAAATSGRAILISGGTVIVAMAGMFFSGNKVFTSFAVGTILVVAMAMVGSVTVLPAALSKLGDKVEKGRVPFLGKLRHAQKGSRVWSWILGGVLRRPAISAAVATGALLVMASPALHLHTVATGVQGIPRDLPIMQTYDRIQAAFPGGPLPAIAVVQAADVTAPAVQQGLAEFEAAALRTDQMNNPIQREVNPDKTLVKVSIPLEGTGTDAASEAALAALRDDVIPSTIGAVEGVRVHVTGITAGSKDFNDTMRSHIPIVFAFVLALAFAILLVTFRSIVVPIKAIVLNLLSVAAAYGVLTWVFQDGHLESVLGFESIGGITAWLPLFLFVVLFGLSMDYHVFILSRVRELVDRGHSTDVAVVEGIKSTAGVVTSAAAVMIAAFAIFATLGALDFKMMGVGLAVAVFLDATIVRAVLLPAAMKLLGERNWYLPGWLEFLPHVAHEGAAGDPVTAPAPEPVPVAVAEPAPGWEATIAEEPLPRKRRFERMRRFRRATEEEKAGTPS
jgi:RND superfamily putative drug exporter